MCNEKNYLKNKVMAMCATVMLTCSVTAFAANTCLPSDVAGSYIRLDVSSKAQLSEVFSLHADGTALWHAGSSILAIPTGTFTPAVGSWACGPDNTVILTVVAYNVLKFGAPKYDKAFRRTYQLQFQSTDLDHPTALRITETNFFFPDDFLSSNFVSPGLGSPVSIIPPSNPRPYVRVKPLPSDVGL